MNDIPKKVEALLQQMTLEEKVAQMIQFPYAKNRHDHALKWAKPRIAPTCASPASSSHSTAP